MYWKQYSKPREKGRRVRRHEILAVFFPGEKREGIINMTLSSF
jgi:hypothetical protein